MTDFLRSVALEDIHIRSGGDGRTVEAYAAIFDAEAEIMDQDGHYMERHAPTAFNKTIADRAGRFPVMYQHGMTMYGTPSDRALVPIGNSIEMRTDAKGVFTVSRYNKTPLADEVLEGIRNGDVTAQSYSGRYLKSDPVRVPRGGFKAGPDGKLRSVTRLEVAMREFGPTPFAAYTGAAITGIRTLLADPLKVAAFLQQYGPTTPDEEPEAPDGDTAAAAVAGHDEPLLVQHSARAITPAMRARAWRITHGLD